MNFYVIKNSVMRKNMYKYEMWNCTASKAVRTVCMAVWEAMSNRFIPTLNEGKWRSIAQGFNKHAHFPNCVGAVDGKLIRIEKQGEVGQYTLIISFTVP
jgi:hypothetical protein